MFYVREFPLLLARVQHVQTVHHCIALSTPGNQVNLYMHVREGDGLDSADAGSTSSNTAPVKNPPA